MKEMLIIIPAHNEAENIEKVISELKSEVPYGDILVINDDSTDKTEEILKKLDVAYLNTPFNFGYSGVLQTGFKYAVMNNYKFAAQFDGDGQHIASELEYLLDRAPV